MGKSKNLPEDRRPLPLRTSPANIASYEHTDRLPGHDGEPPVHVETRDLVEAGGKRERIEGPTNLNHNRVRMLHAREIIDDIQLRAAEMLEADWQLSEIRPMANSALVGNGASGGSGTTLPDAKLDALVRFGEAKRACGRTWPLVEAVVCRNMRIDEAASKMKIHPRRATGRFEGALDALALLYRLR